MCFRYGLGILPPLLVALSMTMLVITYVLSVRSKNTSWFPNVRNTIDHSPERNIFAQLFNWCSFLALVTAFVRYLQLRHDADWNENDRRLLMKLNKVSFALGILAIVGGSIVANFQEDSVEYVSLTGTSVVFTCSILYCWVQSFLSYKMKMCGLINTTLFTVRLILAIALSVCFVGSLTATSIATEKWHLKINATQRWNPKDRNYIPHVVGDVAEWVTALLLLGYILTFCGEFKSVRMKIVVSRNFQHPMPLMTSMESEQSLSAPLLF